MDADRPIGRAAADVPSVLPPRLREPVAVPDLRRSRRRRRPSGKPPPLPRVIGMSGRLWIGAVLMIVVLLILLFTVPIGASFERQESRFLAWLSGIRTGWLSGVMRWIAGLGEEWPNRIVRWAVVAALVVFRRWRHLVVFLGTVLVVAWLIQQVHYLTPRGRPLGVRIIDGWEGFSFPSAPVAAFAVTALGVLYTIVPHGRPRQIGKVVVGVLLLALVIARVYLAVDHPSDDIVAVILGVALPLLAYRLLAPNAVFPVTYGRSGRAAHLDLGGERGRAIRQALAEQLGLVVKDAKQFGLRGSGGSTPMRLVVEGDPDRVLFGKLYAKTHLRSDRWYKLGRTILYGSLEDEKAYNSVRRLVQYEDYLLLVMNEAGIPCARTFGFVEMTPEREYLLVTEFLEGASEITEVEVDERVIDSALTTVRRMWDAGLAHRDIKPANVMVRNGEIVLIDLAFAELRPSPWRQAVDLANMMIVLGLQADPDLVYARAMEVFTLDELAEAFAATRGVTMPSQSRALLKRQRKEGRDVLQRFRDLAPKRRPIAIQRWSVQRIGLTIAVAFGAFVLVSLLIDTLKSGAL